MPLPTTPKAARVRRRGERCDLCGKVAPDVVGPILVGLDGWRTFGIDGVWDGRQWEASVLACKTCAPKMEQYIDHGGQSPRLLTTGGGWATEAEFLADLEAVRV